MKRITFLDMPLDDMVLAVRAVKFLADEEESRSEAFLTFENGRSIFVKRTKIGMSVRPGGPT